MIIDQLFEAPQQCPECGGISFSDLILAEKKDACYHKVKASAKVWPSAYASGRLVQCRKKGAANYGNKSEGVAETRVGQVPMTLKPGETDNLEPEDFEGFRKLPEYLEGQKAQQKAGKDLIQQSPYTYQSDQDWAYRNGAFDARQAAVSADFTKRGPLTTEQGMAENNAVNVPPGRSAITQPDGSTRISKPGSVSRADYAKNMAAYKAQTQTPEKIADFKQRMASGQGYTDTERQANLQQQQQHFGKYADTGDLDEQGMAEGRFQDEYPEYGGKDKNKAMTYDRNAGVGYEGEPWSDSNPNWSGDNPTYADSTYEPDTVTLRGSDGTEKEYSPDSPEYQGVLDREYGIQNKLGQIKKAFTQAEKNNPNAKSQQSSTSSPKFDQFKFDVKTGAVIPNTSSNSTAPVAVKPKSGSWQELAKLNNITDPRKLQAGTYIRTPDGGEVFVNKGDTLSGLAQKMRPTGTSKRQGMKEDDGFDDITTFSDKRTTDQGGKTNQTYSSTTIAKNPTTGQQQSLASWDHTDPKTGKNYSGTSYIDPQGNAKVQKNYKESKKIKVDEVSLGDYRKKATVNKAMAQTNKFFGRDDPAAVAAADRTIAKRERGLGRADARRKTYTAPPVDMEKQRQQLTDKYPNIDQLVRRAEVNRDPNYEYADGQAYYDGQEAEQNYVRLKQIQRIIQGLNEETRQATVNTPVGDFTANITKDKNKNTVSGTMPVGGATLSATKDMTPGGAQSVSVDTNVAPNLNLSATRKSADYNKGQLAGTKSVSAKYTDTTGALGEPGQQHTATRTAGVGFGGASGARVGKNYVTKIDKTLSDYMDEAKGINSIRNPYDLQPLEAGGGGGGGGGRTTSGPSPFGPKPGSREASIAQPNPNTMTIKQGPNPDYRPPSQQSQTTGDKPKIKVNPGETVPQAIERTKTQQEFGKFLQGQSGQTFGAGAGRGSVNPTPANTMTNTPVSVKNKPSAMNSMARDLTNPPKPNNTNTTTTTTNKSPRQNDRVDPLDMPRDPYMPRDPFDMVRPGYDGQLGSNPMPNTRDKQSSWLGKTAKGLGYAAGAYGAADLGSRAWDYYDQKYSDVPPVKEAKKQPPEVEYDDEYDAMVARVKKLAGLGPMKTVYDPKKRQYRNMPTAQQPKK